MTRVTSTGLALLTCLSAACADAYSGRESHAGPRAIPDAGGSDLNANTPGSHVAGSAAPQGREQGDPEPRTIVEQDVLRDSEVWIGELWASALRLCEVGVRVYESYELPAANPAGEVTRVVLVLEPGAHGQPAGRIQLGELEGRELPAAPDVDVFADQQDYSFWACSARYLTKGFEYPLSNLVKRDGRVEFELSPNQLWNSWCEREKPVCPRTDHCARGPATCVCNAGHCAADLRVVVPVHLVQNGETLEGSFWADEFGTTSEVRLKRVR